MSPILLAVVAAAVIALLTVVAFVLRRSDDDRPIIGTGNMRTLMRPLGGDRPPVTGSVGRSRAPGSSAGWMRARLMGRAVGVPLAIVIALWAAVPAIRGTLLVQCQRPSAHITGLPFNAPVESITFRASDGVKLAGWLVSEPTATATVILVHGFKTTRAEMVDRAAFLAAAHYSVLLYDSRGCGESDGTFGVGATEDRDIIGAVNYVRSRGGPAARNIAVFGLSLGAGDALLAAARDRSIDAVIADSAWPDERVQLERMNTLVLGRLALPLLLYEAPVVDTLIGGRLEDARPRDAVDRIVLPHSILFIHCRDDANATTPLADVQAMAAPHGVAGESKGLFVISECGHAGGLAAQPEAYKLSVLSFLSNLK